HHSDGIWRVEGGLLGDAPLEPGADAVAAPGRRIVVERRAVIGETGRTGGVEHGPMMPRGAGPVQRMFSIGAIGRADGCSAAAVSRTAEIAARLSLAVSREMGGLWTRELSTW